MFSCANNDFMWLKKAFATDCINSGVFYYYRFAIYLLYIFSKSELQENELLFSGPNNNSFGPGKTFLLSHFKSILSKMILFRPNINYWLHFALDHLCVSFRRFSSMLKVEFLFSFFHSPTIVVCTFNNTPYRYLQHFFRNVICSSWFLTRGLLRFSPG